MFHMRHASTDSMFGILSKLQLPYDEEQAAGFSLLDVASSADGQPWISDCGDVDVDDGFEPFPVDVRRPDMFSSSTLEDSLEETFKVLFDDDSEEVFDGEVTGTKTQVLSDVQQDPPAVEQDPPAVVFSSSSEDEAESLSVASEAGLQPLGENDEDNTVRFRPYQACQWDVKFDELRLYKKEH
eukprot:scaffold25634_cov127-Cylindrotheca_fusiformis.AAC.1